MSGIWPGDLRCVAMLSFDVDGVSGALNQNPDSARLPSFMSAREYGPSVGAPRILDLLDKYDIKASFYIPGYVAETHEELVLDIQRRGHEIGHHGYMHEPPATLTRDQEAAVLDRGSAILERITGEKPLGYRSPSWELSDDSLTLLIERGFVYDSSLMGNDIPYKVDADGSDIVEIPDTLGTRRCTLLQLLARTWRAQCDGRPRARISRLVGGIRGHAPLRSFICPHHAPLHHRQTRTPAHAGATHPVHPDLPRRRVHAHDRRGSHV